MVECWFVNGERSRKWWVVRIYTHEGLLLMRDKEKGEARAATDRESWEPQICVCVVCKQEIKMLKSESDRINTSDFHSPASCLFIPSLTWNFHTGAETWDSEAESPSWSPRPSRSSSMPSPVFTRCKTSPHHTVHGAETAVPDAAPGPGGQSAGVLEPVQPVDTPAAAAVIATGTHHVTCTKTCPQDDPKHSFSYSSVLRKRGLDNLAVGGPPVVATVGRGPADTHLLNLLDCLDLK